MSNEDDTNKKKFKFTNIEFLGIIAGLFALIGGLQQLIHTYNKKKAEDISYIFLIGTIVSAILWVIYHYKNRGGGAFVITLITLIGLLILLIMKLIYENNDNKKAKKDKKDKKV